MVQSGKCQTSCVTVALPTNRVGGGGGGGLELDTGTSRSSRPALLSNSVALTSTLSTFFGSVSTRSEPSLSRMECTGKGVSSYLHSIL